jgi:hypothetical protein
MTTFRRGAAVLPMLALPLAAAAADDGLRNWFDDPFFQVTSADAMCPLPAGPFVDEQGRREQSHRRAEKGTTGWLAGEYERPKAFAYDEDIAAEVRQAFAYTQRYAASSLWVTVQGRVVYIEGCAADAALAAEAERMVRALPYVQQAIAIVWTDRRERMPYRPRSGGR